MRLGRSEVACWHILVVGIVDSISADCDLDTVRIFFLLLEVDDKPFVG